jgi:hypothetical protein
MEFSDTQRLQLLLSDGLLVRFEPGTIFGNSNAHFGLVINADPKTQRAIVVVCASSQVTKRVEYARLRNFPAATIVIMPEHTNSHFSRQTAFDCNSPEEVDLNVLNQWLEAGMAEVPRNDYSITGNILNEIKAGVLISDMVEENIKDMIRG